MYKAVGEAAYNDGLFSQAAPYQAFQASVSQFGDGGLGAVSRIVANRPMRGRRFHRASAHDFVRRGRPLVGMGNTFLPAFSGAYADGVLGDAASDYAALLVTPAMKIDTATLNQRVDGVKKVTVQLACGLGVLGLAVGYLYMKR
jgi:hypothetical protein